VDILKVDESEISMETRFIEDLKADSMDQFFLIDGFSEKFDLEIPDDSARQIKTVDDAVTYIEANLK
jgi:acyl carrier protein